MIIRGFLLSVGILLSTKPAFAQIEQITKGLGLGKQSELSDSKVASGLKEAL